MDLYDEPLPDDHFVRFCVQCNGTAQGLPHCVHYAGEAFRKRFSVPLEVAIQNDVPGFSWAYPRVFAGSGVKYLITGLNLFIGGGNNFGVRHTPFYWKGLDGSRVLTFFTYESYVEGHRGISPDGKKIVAPKILLNKSMRRRYWLSPCYVSEHIQHFSGTDDRRGFHDEHTGFPNPARRHTVNSTGVDLQASALSA